MAAATVADPEIAARLHHLCSKVTMSFMSPVAHYMTRKTELIDGAWSWPRQKMWIMYIVNTIFNPKNASFRVSERNGA